MNIQILELIDGAKAAKGLTVIIDVFRAMTVEAYVIRNGAADLIPMGSMEDAYAYRDAHPGTILVGERDGKKCPGFDYGNSPSQVKNVDFAGQTVVHTTSAGTQWIANAKGATEILTGSFVNAKAIVKYIKQKNPEDVSLVCMGLEALEPTEEDTLCAEYIKSILEGKTLDMEAEIEKLKTTSGAKFFDKAQNDVFPENDFYMCTQVDKFDFVMKLSEKEDGLKYMTAWR
jgi:2-phosphosulfolactate phosphatase